MRPPVVRSALAAAVGVGLLAALLAGPRADAGLLDAARQAEPVVLTGSQLPGWSRLAAVGTPAPYPSGTTEGQRDAHNGTLAVPPDLRGDGVPVDEIAAFRWDGRRFREIPVQVDERFPYFLANGNSDFGVYSGTDLELTYAWDVEAWQRTAGDCAAAYPPGVTATPDPVPGLDDDDEIVFMASDAGPRAPASAPGPRRTASSRQEIALRDPTGPGPAGYVYLFLRPGGSRIDAGERYVRFERAGDADQWIDRDSFAADDPEQLGTSNRSGAPSHGAGPLGRDRATARTSPARSAIRMARCGRRPTASRVTATS